MVRVSQTLGAAAVTILWHLQGISLCYGETLPEAVKRHEEEIKELRTKLKGLLESRESTPSQIPRTCKKGNFSASYSDSELRFEININHTGITIKLINAVVASGARPNYVVVSSNVNELNNIPLEVSHSYQFWFQGCHYILDIRGVIPGSNQALSLSLETT
jgi:hypothetical protein